MECRNDRDSKPVRFWVPLFYLRLFFGFWCSPLGTHLTYPPKESSLELTVWVPFVWVLSFTLFIVRDFSTPKTCHAYCDGGRIFQNGVFFLAYFLCRIFFVVFSKVDENCKLDKMELVRIEPSTSRCQGSRLTTWVVEPTKLSYPLLWGPADALQIKIRRILI